MEFIDEAGGDTAAIDRLIAEIAVEFREYLSLIVEFSRGIRPTSSCPKTRCARRTRSARHLPISNALKQQLLELSSAEERLDAELGFLRRLLPQLRLLLERKRERDLPESSTAPGGGFRTHQEKFFGKHFSNN